MKIARTYDERINLIREIAERRKKMARVKKQSRILPQKVKVKREFMDVPKEGSNVYAWTDERKYAQQYYGETLYETRKFDNDWD